MAAFRVFNSSVLSPSVAAWSRCFPVPLPGSALHEGSPVCWIPLASFPKLSSGGGGAALCGCRVECWSSSSLSAAAWVRCFPTEPPLPDLVFIFSLPDLCSRLWYFFLQGSTGGGAIRRHNVILLFGVSCEGSRQEPSKGLCVAFLGLHFIIKVQQYPLQPEGSSSFSLPEFFPCFFPFPQSILKAERWASRHFLFSSSEPLSEFLSRIGSLSLPPEYLKPAQGGCMAYV